MGRAKRTPSREAAAAKMMGFASLYPSTNRELLILDAVAVQIVAVGVEPGLGAIHRRADAADGLPEPQRVVHLDQMRDFMCGEIVEHVRRREDQAPGER